jgi:hypothetical protein
VSLRERAITQAVTTSQPSQQLTASSFQVYAYIAAYRKEIVMSYIMNTGYVGTYEPNYKLLFNSRDTLYFEAEGESELKRLKADSVIHN